jgi:lysophospholipase L1-like esterase
LRRIALLAAALLAAAALSIPPSKAASTPAAVRILTVGDSITAAGQWQTELDRLLTATSVPHTISNLAVGGTRCDYWPPRIGALLAQYQPDLVVLACGTNDDANATCFGESCTGWAWRSVVEQVHTWRPTSPAKTLPALIQYSDPLIAPQWLLDYEPRTNDTIYGQFGKYPPAWFAGIVDLQRVPATADFLDDGGIHPTERGYRVVGQLMYRAAAPAMGWPAPAEPAPCSLYGHRRGYPRPAYTPCP